MNEQESAVGEDDRAGGPVFISYATADRAEALKVCKAIERRGTKCWISMRDVRAGRELSGSDRPVRSAMRGRWSWSSPRPPTTATRSRRSSRSPAATTCRSSRSGSRTSSRATPSPTSFRRASGSTPSRAGTSRSTRSSAASGRFRARSRSPRSAHIRRSTPHGVRLGGVRSAIAAAAGLVLLIAAGAWWWLRPSPAAAHSMTVRLAGFQLLSRGPAGNPSRHRGCRDRRRVQRRRRCRRFDGIGPGARLGAGLCAGRDDPARRRRRSASSPA